MHASLPCTVWVAWQNMCVHLYGKDYELELKKRRKLATKMLKVCLMLAEIIIQQGGEFSFEWPRYCAGWHLKELTEFICRHQLQTALVDGCATGLKDKNDEPLLKMFRFICSSPIQARALGQLRCKHPAGFKHGEISGSTTKHAERYTEMLSRRIIAGWFQYIPFGPHIPGCASTSDKA